ncbi:hypothetical protein GCM10025868_25480 [Angustibacter aerolatus]|uniref:Uncharacterized protein n=1 Tax=Angustibacter aerolatus TaxID=1162965 RepID=A0ABQ6JGI5_9ACTN|nr:hypothetical protein GCM10025868_25480 [Angustibacter aerolatus]
MGKRSIVRIVAGTMWLGSRLDRCRRRLGAGGFGRGDGADEGRERPVPLAVLRDHDGGVGDVGVVAQRRLDLGGLDAVAADLDLVVAAPDELQRAVGRLAADVARPVEPLDRPLRRPPGDEPLGSEVVAAEVAARQAGPAEVDLALLARDHRPTRVVEQHDVDGRSRSADGRQAWPAGGVAAQHVRRHDVRLRGSVVVVQRAPGQPRQQPLERGRDLRLLAGGHDLAQRRRRLLGALAREGQALQRREGQEQALDRCRPQQGQQRPRVAPGLLRHKHQGAARPERREDLLHRHVEGER